MSGWRELWTPGLPRLCMPRIAGGSLASQPSQPSQPSLAVGATHAHAAHHPLATHSLRSQRLQRSPALKQVACRHCFVLALIITPSCRVRTHTTQTTFVSPHAPHHSCPFLSPPQLLFPPPLISPLVQRSTPALSTPPPILSSLEDRQSETRVRQSAIRSTSLFRIHGSKSPSRPSHTTA